MQFSITVDPSDMNRLHVKPTTRTPAEMSRIMQNARDAIVSGGTDAQKRNHAHILHIQTFLSFWQQTPEGQWLGQFDEEEVLVGGRIEDREAHISVVFRDPQVRAAFKDMFGI